MKRFFILLYAIIRIDMELVAYSSSIRTDKPETQNEANIIDSIGDQELNNPFTVKQAGRKLFITFSKEPITTNPNQFKPIRGLKSQGFEYIGNTETAFSTETEEGVSLINDGKGNLKLTKDGLEIYIIQAEKPKNDNGERPKSIRGSRGKRRMRRTLRLLAQASKETS